MVLMLFKSCSRGRAVVKMIDDFFLHLRRLCSRCATAESHSAASPANPNQTRIVLYIPVVLCRLLQARMLANWRQRDIRIAAFGFENRANLKARTFPKCMANIDLIRPRC